MLSHNLLIIFLIKLIISINYIKCLQKLENGNYFVAGSGCGTLKPLIILKELPKNYSKLQECTIIQLKDETLEKNPKEVKSKNFDL